jgi:hypothetical protein
MSSIAKNVHLEVVIEYFLEEASPGLYSSWTKVKLATAKASLSLSSYACSLTVIAAIIGSL